MTRVGDVGFLAGLILLYLQDRHVQPVRQGRDIRESGQAAGFVHIGPLGLSLAAMAGLLLFCGAVGKSAQFPLHVWLPDAMEGPTPVSALIHAATMVAAGVYLVARMYPVFLSDTSHVALHTVAYVGAFTALFAASIGIAQNDIKKVLAYSTISQLGYMIMALGVFGYVAAMFHLMTHAFFKAQLFLGSGSVIHGTGTQDIREMGGLRKKMPCDLLDIPDRHAVAVRDSVRDRRRMEQGRDSLRRVPHQHDRLLGRACSARSRRASTCSGWSIRHSTASRGTTRSTLTRARR